MNSVHSRLRACLAAAAFSVTIAGCGGGDGAADPGAKPMAGTGTRMFALAAVVQPPSCTVSSLATSQIDFGQVGWQGDDSPGLPVPTQSMVSASVAFTDDAAVPHTATWTWGDDSQSAGTIVETGGGGSASATHTYLAAGIYTVSVTIAGNSCTTATATRQLVVYDPSVGFVTGGGWISSPAGAYAVDPTLVGRANFGFVSKYLKGATVPSGQTEFQFQAAHLNFHGDLYEWLVVSGARAQYKGSGSLNGAPGYTFMVTAVDGNMLGTGVADRFRIRIWHAGGDGSDVVDYDNQVDASLVGGNSEGTAIGGGSIVIHK
jgi:hypothetical protein